MKKFTLTLIAAFLVVGGAFAQGEKISEPSFDVKEIVKVPEGFKLDKASLSQKSTVRRVSSDKTVASFTPLGAFTWSCYTYNGEWDMVENDAVIKEIGSVSENGVEALLVNIIGMFPGYDLVAKLYPDNTFEILPDQQVYYASYPSYGIEYDFVLTALGEDGEAPITGTVIYDDKDVNANVQLVFDNNIDLIRKQRGTTSYYYPYYVYGEFDRSTDINGFMEVTWDPDISTNGTQVYPVVLSQNGNVLSIGNFLGFGETVNVTLNANKTITIPNQIVWAGGDVYGDFYMYAADYTRPATYWSDFITGTTVYGSGNENEISWGSFFVYAPETGYRWAGGQSGAKVYYINGVGERYDYSNPETAAKAPRFGFGGGEGTTNIKAATAAEAVSESYVDVAGRKVTAATKGLVLKTVTYADGMKKTVKVINR